MHRLKVTTDIGELLKAEILAFVRDHKANTWIIHHEHKDYLKHLKHWGEKGVIGLSTRTDEPETLYIDVIRFNRVEQDLDEFAGFYLGRFCELLFMYFPDRISAIKPVF